MIGLGPNFTMRKLHLVPTAVLIVTMTLWYLSQHIQLLKTVSIGNRFPWLYINCFQSLWFQCIIIKSGIFLWYGASREGVARFTSQSSLQAFKMYISDMSFFCQLTEFPWFFCHSSISLICLIHLSLPDLYFCTIRSITMFLKVLNKVNFKILAQI